MSNTTKPAAQKNGSLRMMIFGAVVMVFAIIGLISSVIFVGQGVSSLVNQDSQKEDFEWLITPLVLQDPPQFENPEQMTDSTIITAGIWRLIMNADMSAYPTDSMNFVTVPETDVEIQIRALFGDVEYTHQTVGDTALMITYDESSKSYVFPAVPYIMAYTPDVEEIEKIDGDTMVLTVGYIPPGLVWQSDTSGRSYRPEPVKEMLYTVKKSGDAWTVYSVTNAGDVGHEYDVAESSQIEEPSVPETSEVSGETSEPAEEPAESSQEESTTPEESSAEESAAA